MRYTVYLIRHICTGTVLYVGKTKNFRVRKYEHLHLRTNTKDWIVEIGTSNISIEKVAEFENEVDALKYEDELINRYGTIENGYNKQRSGLIATSSRKKEYQQEYQQRDVFKVSHQKRQADYFAAHHDDEDFKQHNRDRMKLYRLRKKLEKMAS